MGIEEDTNMVLEEHNNTVICRNHLKSNEDVAPIIDHSMMQRCVL